MKHIREILAERSKSLFGTPQEKGSGEWSVFDAVRGDSVGAYRVRLPKAVPEVRYPNTVRIAKIERQLILKPR